MCDLVIKDLIDELTSKFNCHTIILYGSRARGDATPTSDYDLIGIKSDGDKSRIARFDSKHKVFLDLFIYPEKELENPTEEHLTMYDGIVLIEKNGFGKKLLSKINNVINEPYILPPYELEVRKVWYEKMLTRAKTKDIEGMYRHTWSLYTLLEDYFAFRNRRYFGSKKSFQFLEKNDPVVFNLYKETLAKPTNLKLLEKLINHVTQEERG